jgi:hypothetical protein
LPDEVQVCGYLRHPDGPALLVAAAKDRLDRCDYRGVIRLLALPLADLAWARGLAQPAWQRITEAHLVEAVAFKGFGDYHTASKSYENGLRALSRAALPDPDSARAACFARHRGLCRLRIHGNALMDGDPTMNDEARLEVTVGTKDDDVLVEIEGALSSVQVKRWPTARIVEPITVLGIAASTSALVSALLVLKDRLLERQHPPPLWLSAPDGTSVPLADATAESLEALLSVLKQVP